MFTNCQNRGLSLRLLIKKEIRWSGKTDFLVKKFFQFWEYSKTWKDPSLLISLKKGATINSIFYRQLLWQNLLFLVYSFRILNIFYKNTSEKKKMVI